MQLRPAERDKFLFLQLEAMQLWIKIHKKSSVDQPYEVKDQKRVIKQPVCRVSL